MRNLLAIAMVCAAMGTSGAAFAACSNESPDAITSKPAEGTTASGEQAGTEAKGIAEDGQHTPMETDPNAPGVTKSAGGTTTNTAQAEAEIAAASGTGADASGTDTAMASSAASGTTAAGADNAGCTN